VLVGVALVFVCLRGYVRIMQRQRPTLSDVFVVLAWLAFVSCCACDLLLNQLGLFAAGRTYDQPLTTINEDPRLTIQALKVPFSNWSPNDKQVIYGSALPYYTDLWLVKAAIIAFYYQVIPHMERKIRGALVLLSGCVGVTYIVVMGLNTFYCEPISSNWFKCFWLFCLTSRSLSTESQCINCSAYPVFFPSVMSNIVIDILSKFFIFSKS
jgi:hypothetical protein